MSKPRILCWDIESSQNLVAVFQLKQQDPYINSDNIIQERFVICAAWKILGEKRIYSVSLLDDLKRFNANPTDDYHVLSVLREALASADFLIAHNGDNFDSKFVRGRMLVQGLPLLPPIPSVDTLRTAQTQFLLNANNLNYLGALLGVGGKKHTHSGLWLRVLRGDPKAIKEMVAYNKQDVALLERVYLKLRPYVPNHINRQMFEESMGCPRCGNTRVQSRGFHHALTQTYQKFCCLACGGWYRLAKADPAKRIMTRVL